jgi:bacterioferritin
MCIRKHATDRVSPAAGLTRRTGHLALAGAGETRLYPCDMQELDADKAITILNAIMEYELAGVVRYTHYALMVTGPNRIPIVDFMSAQASESLLHAQRAGEILTGLEGHPSLGISDIEETHQHSVEQLLTESLNHELKALSLYKQLLDVAQDASVYLEEYARQMIGTEELHAIELRKMLRDFSPAM